jgi:hypothetical protein
MLLFLERVILFFLVVKEASQIHHERVMLLYFIVSFYISHYILTIMANYISDSID